MLINANFVLALLITGQNSGNTPVSSEPSLEQLSAFIVLASFHKLFPTADSWLHPNSHHSKNLTIGPLLQPSML